MLCIIPPAGGEISTVWRRQQRPHVQLQRCLQCDVYGTGPIHRLQLAERQVDTRLRRFDGGRSQIARVSICCISHTHTLWRDAVQSLAASSTANALSCMSSSMCVWVSPSLSNPPQWSATACKCTSRAVANQSSPFCPSELTSEEPLKAWAPSQSKEFGDCASRPHAMANSRLKRRP